MIETDLHDFLLNVAPLTALVGQRVYSLVREQGMPDQLPSVRVQRRLTTRFRTFCGTDPLIAAQIQIDSFGIDQDSAGAVAKALRKALVDFKGQMGATPVDDVSLDNEFPLTDPDPGVIHVAQIYNFWFEED